MDGGHVPRLLKYGVSSFKRSLGQFSTPLAFPRGSSTLLAHCPTPWSSSFISSDGAWRGAVRLCSACVIYVRTYAWPHTHPIIVLLDPYTCQLCSAILGDCDARYWELAFMRAY